MTSIGTRRTIAKVKRYLADLRSLQLHDTRREHPRCHLHRVPFEYRRWYDSVTEAGASREYGRCWWCFEESR